MQSEVTEKSYTHNLHEGETDKPATLQVAQKPWETVMRNDRVMLGMDSKALQNHS